MKISPNFMGDDIIIYVVTMSLFMLL